MYKTRNTLCDDPSPLQTKFLGPLSNYFSCIISDRLTNCFTFSHLENNISHLYNEPHSREKNESRVTFSVLAESEKTINFSTVQFKNSSPHHRRSITSPKNRATAYAFLFPQQSIYPSDDTSIVYTTRDIFSPSLTCRR